MTTHKVATRAALLLVVLTVVASAARAQPSADPLAPFGWFKDLAGYCWSGTHADGKASDTQCYSVQFGRFLRGTIKLSGQHGDQPVDNFGGDSVYAWNPKMNRVHYTLWASDGTYATGAMHVEGERLIFPSANPDSPSATRFVWARIDADNFVVTREERQGKAWSKVVEVKYRRSEAKPAR